MAREIKFRAWDGKILTHLDALILNPPSQNVLMQYTGLKDMYDTEIYMKDIVKREFEVWQTVWEGSLERNNLAPTEEFVCAGYFIGVVSQTPQGLYVLNQCNKFDEDGNFIQKRSNVKLYAHRCEVIGNIYENPELLEVQGE